MNLLIWGHFKQKVHTHPHTHIYQGHFELQENFLLSCEHAPWWLYMTLVNISTYHYDILEDIYISQNRLRSCLNYSSYRNIGDYTLSGIVKQRCEVCVFVCKRKIEWRCERSGRICFV